MTWLRYALMGALWMVGCDDEADPVYDCFGIDPCLCDPSTVTVLVGGLMTEGDELQLELEAVHGEPQDYAAGGLVALAGVSDRGTGTATAGDRALVLVDDSGPAAIFRIDEDGTLGCYSGPRRVTVQAAVEFALAEDCWAAGEAVGYDPPECNIPEEGCRIGDEPESGWFGLVLLAAAFGARRRTSRAATRTDR